MSPCLDFEMIVRSQRRQRQRTHNSTGFIGLKGKYVGAAIISGIAALKEQLLYTAFARAYGFGSAETRRGGVARLSRRQGDIEDDVYTAAASTPFEAAQTRFVGVGAVRGAEWRKLGAAGMGKRAGGRVRGGVGTKTVLEGPKMAAEVRREGSAVPLTACERVVVEWRTLSAKQRIRESKRVLDVVLYSQKLEICGRWWSRRKILINRGETREEKPKDVQLDEETVSMITSRCKAVPGNGEQDRWHQQEFKSIEAVTTERGRPPMGGGNCKDNEKQANSRQIGPSNTPARNGLAAAETDDGGGRKSPTAATAAATNNGGDDDGGEEAGKVHKIASDSPSADSARHDIDVPPDLPQSGYSLLSERDFREYSHLKLAAIPQLEGSNVLGIEVALLNINGPSIALQLLAGIDREEHKSSSAISAISNTISSHDTDHDLIELNAKQLQSNAI
ncbi:hypothetical protein R3P38DRAFT_2802142 [Favolaschia claudopus]|uniref:Uncharacterized protein n=1 Tax=Favolaschia claudopus TaxID=2862362 RepID=A0AAV9ZUW0_9AGAR